MFESTTKNSRLDPNADTVAKLLDMAASEATEIVLTDRTLMEVVAAAAVAVAIKATTTPQLLTTIVS